MLIRAEQENDRDAVYAVNASAFESPSEANLVTLLRQQAHPVISFVAEDSGEIVGHIMFSPVSLLGHPNVKLVGLAPLAVVPEQQRKGIGSALVRAGLDECRELGFVAVVVLGHPEFYHRLGFSPSTRFDIDSDYEVPEEAFMAMELQPGALGGRSGRIRYHAAFGNL